MKYTLTLLTLLFAVNAAHAQTHVRTQQSYKVLQEVPDDLSFPDGRLVKVFSFAERDTLTLYLQHRETSGVKINTELSKQADIVFYCFPRTAGSHRFAIPDAGGRVYTAYYPDTKILVLFDDGKHD